MRSALALVLVLLVAAPAAAQDADATHAAAARALFAEGVAAADIADWATAAERFRRARGLRTSATISLNLGIALTHLGQLVEAAELLRGVLRDGTADAELRATATATLADIEPRIAWIDFTLEGPREGILLEADGRPLSLQLAGTAVPFDPGPHQLAAVRDGAVVASAEVSLVEGSRVPLTLTVPPPEPEPAIEPIVEPVDEAPVVPVDEGPPPSGPDALAIGLGVGAGVLVLGGVITLVIVLAMPGEQPFVGNAGMVEIGR